MQVNLFDQNFSHVKNSMGYDASCFVKPTRGEWVRNQISWSGDTVFTDEMCYSNYVDCVKTDRKIAWLMESPGVKPHVYQNFSSVQSKFEKVITFLDIDAARSIGISDSQYVNCSLGGAWVEPTSSDVKKTKICSLIASTKNDLPGHKLRHEIAKLHKWIDLYGRGYKPIENKSEALRDYAFSVVIENVSFSGYFTEKLIDCMLMRSIPIYYGDPNIDSKFDKRGILSIDDIDNLSFDRYESMLGAVNSNFELAFSLRSIDDNVFKAIEEAR